MSGEKKRILVTGASSGIGESTARLLIDNGNMVVATSRNEKRLLELYGDIVDVSVIPFDLSDPGLIDEYVKEVVSKAGPINGLVHCAGMDLLSPVYMTKASDIENVFKLNTFSAIKLVGAFSKKNMVEKPASFVLVSSLSAHEGASGRSVYAASKAALEGFTEAASPELSARGIRINCIAPGIVETHMSEGFLKALSGEQLDKISAEYPLGFGKPEDIAAFIEYLISEKSKWITGRTFILDGGHLTRK